MWYSTDTKPTKNGDILVGKKGYKSQLASFDIEDPDYLTVLVRGGWAENVEFSRFDAWMDLPQFSGKLG